MAYGNMFPATYPQYYPQYPQAQAPVNQQASPQPQIQQSQQNNPMTWVQGETGAKSFLLAPNTTMPLWDSERQTIYLKSADASGMPSMKILDYTIREQSAPQQINNVVEQPQNHVDYVTKQELSDFKSEIKEMVKKELGA